MQTTVQPTTDRRRGLRVTFATPERRPTITLGDGTHPIIDLAPQGLRLRHLDPVRPAIGHRLQGMVHAPDGSAAPVDGVVVWTSPTELGLSLDRAALPLGFVMALVARERDRAEGGLA
jgi:hypothetical protein